MSNENKSVNFFQRKCTIVRRERRLFGECPLFYKCQKVYKMNWEKILANGADFFHVNLNQFWKWSILSFLVLFYFHLENFISKTYFDVLRVIKDLLHIQTMFRLIK